MAGNCLPNETLNQLIDQWLAVSLPAVANGQLVSIHLDQLLGRSIDSSEAIAISIQAFEQLLKPLRALHLPVKPMLVIPLTMLSQRIERAIPANLEALAQELTNEPPSLYLLDWTPLEYFGECEEYRSPLPFKLLNHELGGTCVYYREYRYAPDIKHNWEFMRAIYAECYQLADKLLVGLN